MLTVLVRVYRNSELKVVYLSNTPIRMSKPENQVNKNEAFEAGEPAWSTIETGYSVIELLSALPMIISRGLEQQISYAKGGTQP